MTTETEAKALDAFLDAFNDPANKGKGRYRLGVRAALASAAPKPGTLARQFRMWAALSRIAIPPEPAEVAAAYDACAEAAERAGL